MSVAKHFGIAIEQFDQRIGTFIPHYQEMLEVAAGVAGGSRVRTIVDLGVGTGALAARCLARAPRARLIGLDADAEILTLARQRLGENATLRCRDFLRASLPQADAIVASFALHHVRVQAAKRRLYGRVFAALRPGGVFVTADCHPARDRALAAADRRAWQSHLRRSYTATQTSAIRRVWAREDVYVPLEVEVGLLRQGGFRVEVVWRRECFAVLMARR